MYVNILELLYFRGKAETLEVEHDDDLEHNFPIHGSDLSCGPRADNIHDCSFNNDTKHCSHYDDVYIQCKCQYQCSGVYK